MRGKVTTLIHERFHFKGFNQWLGDGQIERCRSSFTPVEGSVATLNMPGSRSDKPKKKLQRRFPLQDCGKSEIRKYSLTAT